MRTQVTLFIHGAVTIRIADREEPRGCLRRLESANVASLAVEDHLGRASRRRSRRYCLLTPHTYTPHPPLSYPWLEPR
eukprot:6371532-Prymnesium_polylepis.1